MQEFKQYAVAMRDPSAAAVLGWIHAHELQYEIHLNRTRFWVPTNTPLYTEFALRWADTCFMVQDPELIDSQDC